MGAQAGGPPQIWGRSDLSSELQAGQANTMGPCLTKEKKTNKQIQKVEGVCL